jgi:hypothetical protein
MRSRDRLTLLSRAANDVTRLCRQQQVRSETDSRGAGPPAPLERTSLPAACRSHPFSRAVGDVSKGWGASLAVRRRGNYCVS